MFPEEILEIWEHEFPSLPKGYIGPEQGSDGLRRPISEKGIAVLQKHIRAEFSKGRALDENRRLCHLTSRGSMMSLPCSYRLLNAANAKACAPYQATSGRIVDLRRQDYLRSQ
eukprot:1379812-Amphidinium_carterae.1